MKEFVETLNVFVLLILTWSSTVNNEPYLQQWLCERETLLHYTYITCPVEFRSCIHTNIYLSSS
jgi:hypothetical protein